MIRLEYTLGPSDLLEMLRLHRKRHPLWKDRNFWAGMALVAIVIFIVGGITEIGLRAPGDDERRPSVWVLSMYWALGLASTVGIVRQYSTKRMAKRLWKKTPGIQDEVVIEISDTGIRESNGTVSTEWGWHAFTGFVESDGVFLVLLPNQRQLIIPKRAVADMPHLNQLREFIAGHVMDARNDAGFRVLQVKKA